MSRTASFGSPIADNVPPSSYYGGTDDATRPAYSGPGYLSTDPHGGSSIVGGGMEPSPSPAVPRKGSPSSEVPRISPDSAISTSVKARAAYQHRRPPLVVHNVAEGDTRDTIPSHSFLPSNAPVTPGVPPPAYSPGERDGQLS